ncbi:hypothetical protein F5882DRAFT_383454 [Hyaloscypha sp. PMI_1271]|nr:hypothetical protein F5882DRAFT_383454 [Hyaloscypha sp. PMI_1271]
MYRDNVEIRYSLLAPSLLLSPTDSRSTGADEEIARAALIYDIGQFLPIDETKAAQMGTDTPPVGRLGNRMIGENVVRLVGSRVAAKCRYLTAVYTRYYNGLPETNYGDCVADAEDVNLRM